MTNEADTDIYLSRVEMFLCYDLCAKGLSSGKYSVFRSGRHKNDMPGVFVTGEADDRLFDVSSGMTESGDKETADDALSGGYLISSDHLTLIKDHMGKILSLEFLTGRNQLFETRIKLGSDANIEYIKSEVIFNIYISPGETLNTESMRIALVDNAQKEIESFASRKAALYGSRNTRRPAVFCTRYFYDTKAEPLEVMSAERFPGAIKVSIPGTYTCFFCITNWSDAEKKEILVDMSVLTKDKDAKYVVCGFYSGIYKSGIGACDIVKMGEMQILHMNGCFADRMITTRCALKTGKEK